MKIVDGFILTPVGEDWVAVATGEASEVLHGIVRLNKTAKLIWEGIDSGLDEQGLVKSLTEHYEVDEATAARSVARVVSELKTAGLIEG